MAYTRSMYFIIFRIPVPIILVAATAVIIAVLLTIFTGIYVSKKRSDGYIVMATVFYLATVTLLIVLPVGSNVNGVGVIREVENSLNLRLDLLRFLRHQIFLRDFFINILLLLPFGFLTTLVIKKGWLAVFACIGVAFFLEGIQLLVPGRVTDINDMIYNIAGGIIGVVAASLLRNRLTGKIG